MGSAKGPTLTHPGNIEKARQIGACIAEKGYILITGACPGLPDEAAKGAKHVGGFVFGVSPAFSHAEHIQRYRSPTQHYDLIQYSGLGLMERDILNIRTCDAIVILGGGMGTLNEFTVAYDEGKIIGVCTGMGGISGHIPEIIRFCERELDRPGLIFEADPQKLINKIDQAIKVIPHPFEEDSNLLKD